MSQRLATLFFFQLFLRSTESPCAHQPWQGELQPAQYKGEAEEEARELIRKGIASLSPEKP